MAVHRFLLGAALLLAAPLVPSIAYQHPILEPGGTWTCTVHVWNDRQKPVTTSAKARVRGHPYWGPLSAARGPWLDIPAQTLEPGEDRTLEVTLTIPSKAPPVLAVEVRSTGGGFWRGGDPWNLPMAEGSEPGYRTVGGGRAAWNVEGDRFPFAEEVVRTVEEWDALRTWFGIVSPDSWGLPPDGNDPQPPFGGGPLLFAGAEAPDLETETLLAIRAPEHGPQVDPRRFSVRSITTRSDGTVVCRYTWRYHRYRGGLWPAIMEPGDFLLLAIPRTDAPIVFRRVP